MTDDKSDCQVKAHPAPTAYDDDISNSTDVQILPLAITLQCNPLFIIIIIIITTIIIIIIMITSLVTRRFELWNISNSIKFFLFQFNCQRAVQGGNYDWIQKLLLNSIFTFFWQNNLLLQKLNSSLQAKPPSCYIVGHSCLILWFLKRISCPKTVGREWLGGALAPVTSPGLQQRSARHRHGRHWGQYTAAPSGRPPTTTSTRSWQVFYPNAILTRNSSQTPFNTAKNQFNQQRERVNRAAEISQRTNLEIFRDMDLRRRKRNKRAAGHCWPLSHLHHILGTL